MDKEEYRAAQEILKTKLGNFYFKAKLGKEPKPEDLSGFFLSGEIGTLGYFNYFIEKYGNRKKIAVVNLITCVKKLSKSNRALIVGIMDQVMPLPPLIRSEKFRKEENQKLLKAENQRHRRKKKKEWEGSKEAIEKMKVLKKQGLMFDINMAKALEKERINSLQPSDTLFILKHITKEGLLYVVPGGRKSSKGFQSLINFVLIVYRLLKNNTKLSDNAIFEGTGRLLDILNIKTSTGKRYTREKVRDLVNNHIHEFSEGRFSSDLH
ncbi:MAG TPA: hypothetical protein VMW09_01710 [Desulfatiglandales bacterium]|nr:hypothetical protein [Desulfatiglandales bacterium]